MNPPKVSKKLWRVNSLSRGFYVGVHSVGATPVPMPNTEVKPHYGDNTWDIKPWEDSKTPA